MITFNEIVLGEDMVKTGLFENVLAYCAQQYRKQLLAEQTRTNLQNMLLHPSLFLLVFSASCQLLFDSKKKFLRQTLDYIIQFCNVVENATTSFDVASKNDFCFPKFPLPYTTTYST